MATGSGHKPLILRIVSRMAIGGVQRGILNTLKRADRERFDYALLCTKKEGVWGDQARALGVPVITQKTLPPWNPFQILRLARVIRGLRPDLVHVHMAPTVIPAATAARLAGVRHIVVQHHNLYDLHWNQQNALLRSWEFRLTKGADAIIGVSEPVAECTRRRLGLPEGRVLAIPNGIDLALFRGAAPHDPRAEWGAPGQAPLVMLVARYLETKRVEDFIEAAALILKRWRAPGAAPFFVIVGDGPEHLKRLYEEKIAAMGGAAASARLVGGRHDLPNILPHAAVGVVTSELEGCPNTILEFMAAGAPIAATDIGPITAIVRDGEQALLCPPRQPARLADNIERLLRDRALAARLADSARAAVQAYDWQTTIRAYEAVYARALGL